MRNHRDLIACTFIAALLLSATAMAAPCRKLTNTYLWPTAPKYYECCTSRPELVLAAETSPTLGDDSDEGYPERPRSVVTLNPHSTSVLRQSVEATCVDLSDLSLVERALRQTRVGSCVRFVSYDHFPCTCETSCDPEQEESFWTCNCPGLKPGELPVIKEQDSLRSQPEFVGQICQACNTASFCCDGEPPTSGGLGNQPIESQSQDGNRR